MEDAAHRTWSKKQLKIDKRGQEMIEKAGRIENEMRDFIRKCLDIVFPSNQTDIDDVELEDFTIPMISEETATNPLLGNLISIRGDNDNVQGAPADIHIGEIVTKKKSSYIGKAQVIEKKKVEKNDEKNDMTGGKKSRHHVNPQPNTPSSGDDNYIEDENRKERVIRERFDVKYRIFYDVDEEGGVHYTLIVHSPITAEKAYLTLTPVSI